MQNKKTFDRYLPDESIMMYIEPLDVFRNVPFSTTGSQNPAVPSTYWNDAIIVSSFAVKKSKDNANPFNS